MSGDDFAPPRVPSAHLDPMAAHQAAIRQAAKNKPIPVPSVQVFPSWIDEGTFNPVLMSRRFETLESKRKRTAKEEEAARTEQADDTGMEVQRVEEIGDEFYRRNPELQPRSLALLRSRISKDDTQEEILHKVLEMYPDHSLADEALDYLLQTSKGSLADRVRRAKQELNALYSREIKAGRNIASQAREFSQQGLGSPSGLRNLYREVTGNPRDANTLFSELTSKFNYDKMKTVISFLLHSMGGDLKSKGPSIDRGELHRLLTETRKLQGILGIFRFFQSRMNLIMAAFARQGFQLPMLITFEMLAKQFMKALQERYPSADKILQLAKQLGLSEEELAQVIILTQMRDGVRQVAPNLYRSDQHRQDLLNAFMDAIEELDERIEEEEEEEEKDEKEEEEK